MAVLVAEAKWKRFYDNIYRKIAVEQVFGELLDQMHGFHPSAMKKRRQSMPSGRAYSGVDVSEIERIAKKHTRSICVIS
uniref:DDE Tnp4 domain-containing protein n=1 Tax=Parascaris equorum TaxID=6256 RepID=A0A914RBK0_PAREQ